MKKSKLNKIMLIVAIIIAICCVSTIIRATSDVSEIMDIPQLPDSGNNATTNGNNTTTNPSKNIGTIGGGKNNNTRNITANTAKPSIPKTGANDTVLWVLIGVTTIAAIYTYKKVRDYNV